MGEKRKRQGQYILPLSALCLVYVAMMGGCRLMPVKAASDHVEVTSSLQPEVVPVETVDTHAGPLPGAIECPLLDQAESYLANGDYPNAMDAVGKALADCGPGDGAFFRRALTIMLDAAASKAPSKGGPDALACFRELESPMPDNGPAARCWLEILNELADLKVKLQTLKAVSATQKKRIKALKSQLEQLKAVDLELGTPEADDASHE